MASTAVIKRNGKQDTIKLVKKYWILYVFLAFPIAHVIIFTLMPMYGITIAFKDFKMARGIWASDWVGLKHFIDVFTDSSFWKVVWNTIKISVLTIAISFPATIIFALLVNELLNIRFKKVVQTITYMPHFLSWIIVGQFVYQILSPENGIVNAILLKLGVISESIYFMVEEALFIPIYIFTTLWKDTGYGIVVYLAAITSIDGTLYEAAEIDGANRLQRVLYITLPSLYPIISIMLILRMGAILNVGFDPIFSLYNASTYRVADVISTYVYRKGLVEAQYSMTTVIGLFQNVIGLALVLTTNWLARKADPNSRVL
ncbi:MAG: ABC transporter permease subunit [Eubacteriales bacterium]